MCDYHPIVSDKLEIRLISERLNVGSKLSDAPLLQSSTNGRHHHPFRALYPLVYAPLRCRRFSLSFVLSQHHQSCHESVTRGSTVKAQLPLSAQVAPQESVKELDQLRVTRDKHGSCVRYFGKLMISFPNVS